MFESYLLLEVQVGGYRSFRKGGVNADRQRAGSVLGKLLRNYRSPIMTAGWFTKLLRR